MMVSERSHCCRYRDDSGGWWDVIRDWYLVPLHFFATLSFVLGVILAVDGQDFSLYGNRAIPGRLYQPDAVTLISVALIAVRSLAAMWLALAGWRMGFIVMEKGGASLTEINRLISYRIPMLRRSEDRTESGRRSGYSIPVLLTLWLIFLLATPAQFVAPIATGAIIWTPATALDPMGTVSNVAITTAGDTKIGFTPWFQFEANQFARNYVKMRADGLASLAAPTNFQEVDAHNLTFRRRIPSIVDSAPGTQFSNVTVPSFIIHDLEWIQDASDLTWSELSAIYNAEIESGNGTYTNFSSDNNPISSQFATDIGVLSILPTQAWQPEQYHEVSEDDQYFDWPKPQVVSDSYLVIVLTHRDDPSYYQPWEYCGEVPSPKFGDTSKVTSWLQFNNDTSGFPHCYAVARVNFSAGVMDCQNCPVVAPGLVEYSTSPGSNPALLPDPLTATAIAMMPEQMVDSAIINSSFAPTWGNLDGYTRGAMSIAFQASWNAMSNEFPAPDNQIQTASAVPPINSLRATVTRWRLVLWGGANALTSVSGVLLAILQRSCRAKTIRHPALAALLLDASPLLRADKSGLCNATSLTRKDGRQGSGGSVRLLVQPRDQPGYFHPLLLSTSTVEDDRPSSAQKSCCHGLCSSRGSSTNSLKPVLETKEMPQIDGTTVSIAQSSQSSSRERESARSPRTPSSSQRSRVSYHSSSRAPGSLSPHRNNLSPSPSLVYSRQGSASSLGGNVPVPMPTYYRSLRND